MMKMAEIKELNYVLTRVFELSFFSHEKDEFFYAFIIPECTPMTA